MTKSDAREAALKLRDSLGSESLLEKSRLIFEKIIFLDNYKEAENILIYASMRSEADTTEIILDALSCGKRVFCPKVVDRKNGLMKFVCINSLEDLTEGYFGIREPSLPQDYEEPVIDECKTLMIMPGVAFDKHRNRAGYSGGFYDRYLARHKALFTVAIAFECQVVDGEIKTDDYDVRPDMLITEENIY